jgi:hypothetical protein
LRSRLPTRTFTFAHLLLTIELALVFFFSLRPAIDPDYGWHVANGWHVLDGTIFGGRDIYSWTASGLWVAHEWATELVMGIVHRIAGPTGNSILAGTLGLAVYAVVCVRLRISTTRWSALLLALPIIFVGAMRSVGVRPLMLELLYVSLLLLAIDLYLAGRVSRVRSLALLISGSALWANSHGSFILLPVILWITSAELVLSRDARWREFLIGGIAALLAAILNPWGLELLRFALQSIQSQPTLAYIDEWKRPALGEALSIPILLQIALAAVGIIRVWRSRRVASSAAPRYLGIIRTAAFAYLALSSGRHIMLFGIAAAEMIASGLDPVASRIARRLGSLSDSSEQDSQRSLVNIITSAAVVIVVVASAWREISPGAQKTAMAQHYPVDIVSRLLPEIVPPNRMLNEYRWGGYLIMNHALPVFIDGRSELYGDAQLVRYASIVHMEIGWQDSIASLGITRILLPRDSKLAQALPVNGWTSIESDSVGVLFARRK